MTWKEWFFHITDKLIIFLTLVTIGFMVVWFANHGNEAGFSWAQRAYDNIQGAFLMLLTGRAIQRMTDKGDNDNGKANNANQPLPNPDPNNGLRSAQEPQPNTPNNVGG